VIQHRNTRLSGATLLSNTLPTPQETAQENAAAQLANRGQQQGYLSRGGATAAAAASSGGVGQGDRADRGSLVAMTPSPMPGGYLDRGASGHDAGHHGAGGGGGEGGEDGGVSPLMTWGEVLGTPLCLDPSQTPLHGSGGYGGGHFGARLGGSSSSGGLGDEDGVGRFRIGEGSQREALARSLDAQTAAKKAKKRRRAEDELARLTGNNIKKIYLLLFRSIFYLSCISFFLLFALSTLPKLM
jgi:hypothetical protein